MRGIPNAAVVAVALASVIVLAGASTACDGDSPRRTPTQPEVISGPHAGLSTTVDATNYFYLYGVAGELQIRVSSTDRYRPRVETVVVRDHRTINVFLEYIGADLP